MLFYCAMSYSEHLVHEVTVDSLAVPSMFDKDQTPQPYVIRKLAALNILYCVAYWNYPGHLKIPNIK